MRLADKLTIEGGVSGITLMKKAAVAVCQNVDFVEPIAILCGKGNNGGDGYAIAQILYEKGQKCHIISVGEPKSFEAKHYYNIVKEYCEIIPSEKIDSLNNYNTVVDCLLGTGANILLANEYYKLVELTNKSGAFVVSVDINSGLCADSGMVENIAVKSNLTIAIGNKKVGQLLSHSRDYIERLIAVDIGIPINDEIYEIDSDFAKKCFAKKLSFTNKGTYGKCAIMGGSIEYTGAVKLANISICSLISGAGLSTVMIERDLVEYIAPHLMESTLCIVNYDDIDDIIAKVNRIDSLAVGVGWGRSNNRKKVLQTLLEKYHGKLVLDADALHFLKEELPLLKKREYLTILTPHIMEFARLIDKEVKDVQKNVLDYAITFAKEYNIVLVLKSNSTIITNGTIIYVSTSGNACQAKGGSGDVLCGAIAGVLARRDIDINDIERVASITYVAGLSAQKLTKKLGEYGVLPSDTAKNLIDTIVEL